jgi:hypothetical protein
MENYFNYFTEIEERWLQCRGTITLLSPLDWALIESFQESGIPLEVVLRGMEAAFARQSKRASKAQKVNSLSYCTQAILSEFERFQESSVGKSAPVKPPVAAGQAERQNLIEMMERTICQLAEVPRKAREQGLALPDRAFETVLAALESLKQEAALADQIDFEQIELRLSMLEAKIQATLVTALNDEVLLALRTEVTRELNHHRRGLKAEQLAMLEKKMTTKRLFERFDVPRLSLFYMPLN